MSTQDSQSNKTKQLSSAVVIAMSASTSAYAVNFGQTSIQSTQYEPLLATIEVNGIKSQDFNISLANSAIYSQMGLTPNSSISARFERTSADSGRVVLTSSQPIDEPFADIVLNIDNNDKKQFMPKTLLMPISAPPANQPVHQPVLVGNNPNNSAVTNTPEVNDFATNNPDGGAEFAAGTNPIANNPLNNPLNSPSNSPSNNPAQSNADMMANSDLGGQPVRGAYDALDNNPLNAEMPANQQATQPMPPVVQPVQGRTNLPVVTQSLADGVPNEDSEEIDFEEPLSANNHQNGQHPDNILPNPSSSKQIHKSYVSDKTGAKHAKDTSNTSAQSLIDRQKAELAKPIQDRVAVAYEPPIGQVPSDKILLQDDKILNALQTSQNKELAIKVSSKQEAKRKASQSKKSSKKQAKSNNSNRTYVVQRNDNLWTIALEIARRNRLNVHTVMRQIHESNPNAFINGKPNMIIANAKIRLPDYEVIPSQSSLEEAIKARRAQVKASITKRKSSSSTASTQKKSTKKPTKQSAAKSKAKSQTQKASKPNTTSTKKPNVSLVAPNKASNTQSKNSGSSSKGNLVSQLKSARKQTAEQANRVNKLNSKVSSYTQKLQLQNQKLAELEARLKKLKEQ